MDEVDGDGQRVEGGGCERAVRAGKSEGGSRIERCEARVEERMWSSERGDGVLCVVWHLQLVVLARDRGGLDGENHAIRDVHPLSHRTRSSVRT
eukprot:3009733-Rhodomonas_salina.2